MSFYAAELWQTQNIPGLACNMARAVQEDAFKQQQEAQLTFSNRAGHGVAEKRPEDSVYYHPTLNPEGIPPPGKAQVCYPSPTNR